MSHKYRYLYSALLENTVCSVSVVLHKARGTKMVELLYLYLEHNMFYINL